MIFFSTALNNGSTVVALGDSQSQKSSITHINMSFPFGHLLAYGKIEFLRRQVNNREQNTAIWAFFSLTWNFLSPALVHA